MPVDYPVTVACLFVLGVNKFVDHCDLFRDLPGHATHQIVEIVASEVLRNPEGYVVDALWELADGLKYRNKQRALKSIICSLGGIIYILLLILMQLKTQLCTQQILPTQIKFYR